jgi:hypothetical protein
MKLPEHGVPEGELFADMRERKKQDADWESGRTFSLVYPAGKEVDAILRRANEIYVFENALNPFRFPSLRQMEDDVISMTLDLLHGEEGSGGAMTSGGTESILMAVKTARDRAREERDVTSPRLLAPVSAHPAFAKAAKYLGLELVQIPLGPDLRADVDAAARLIDDDTALVVGSAPNYPFGTVDPIPELSALAAERGISFPSCFRSSSGSASPCRPGTSAFPGSRRSRPTYTSTATRPKERRSSRTATANSSRSTSSSCTTAGRAGCMARSRWRVRDREPPSPRPGR